MGMGMAADCEEAEEGGDGDGPNILQGEEGTDLYGVQGDGGPYSQRETVEESIGAEAVEAEVDLEGEGI